jgi:hypothetical protein
MTLGSGMTLGIKYDPGIKWDPGITGDGWFGLRRLRRMRLQQFRGIGDKPCGFASAGYFQDALVVGLHDIFVADPDNRIIFHVRSPSCPSPTGYAKMSRIVPTEKLRKAGWFIAR